MFRKIILSVLIVAVLSCCSSEVSGEKNNDDGLLLGVPSQASKSNDFLSQGDFSTDPDLYNLSESQMSCLVDQLLNFFSPEQVSAITSEGPNVEQKEVALSALELCDLLVTVVNLGIFEGIALTCSGLKKLSN